MIIKLRLFLFAVIGLGGSLLAQEATLKSIKETRDGRQRIYGLVSPLDQEGRNFYLLTVDGQVEVRLADDGQVGLLFRERDVQKQLENREVKIAATDQKFSLPEKLYVRVQFKNWRAAENALKNGEFQDGMLSAKPLPDHLPTEDELWLSGELTGLKKGHITPRKVVTADGKQFEGSTGGDNYAEQIAGLFETDAIRPFVNEASVYGELVDDVFVASHVLLRPVPDQVAKDDPNLPRYLFIGDSISGNYGPGLREALAGKFNIHHPPTNCGPSGKGKNQMQAWLGGYEDKGRHWDVISFNFGHWDAGNTKADYQANLEAVIQQLKPTGAKLTWVTTCPVPNGFEKAGPLSEDEKAPGRTAGVMEKYLNPWAAEVVARHPEISVCDQWQFVKDNADGVYREWWAAKNVHFSGEPAAALGQLLANHVLEVAGIPSAKSKPKTMSKPDQKSKPISAAPEPEIPLFKPGFQYQGKKAYGLYGEDDAAAALPDEWKNVKRLTPGFPDEVSASLKPASVIPDGEGGTFSIAESPSVEVLATVKSKFESGDGLMWYFRPR
ncbi:MAG: SGNH/GDSL hydrolase family protein, partial [Verrucomicrobiota bacterium]